MGSQRMVAGAGHGASKVTARAALAAALVAAAVLATVGGAEPAGAQATDSRQASELSFTSRRPGSSSGLRFNVDYVNPVDPAAKPYAVQTVLQRLAAGARVDTSVPPRCTASDAELMLRGAAACPDARVGGGEVDLDTGAPGPARILANDVTLLNADGQLILLFEQRGAAVPTRAAARAVVSGRTITTEAPPLPGLPPPDPFLAVKRVRLTVDAISRRGSAYVRTPRTCPRSRRWVNSVTYTYRDGVSQTVPTASPCVRASQQRQRRRRAPRFTG